MEKENVEGLDVAEAVEVLEAVDVVGTLKVIKEKDDQQVEKFGSLEKKS